eukprot:8936308-Alexandrium_andersonii.AAC.1
MLAPDSATLTSSASASPPPKRPVYQASLSYPFAVSSTGSLLSQDSRPTRAPIWHCSEQPGACTIA